MLITLRASGLSCFLYYGWKGWTWIELKQLGQLFEVLMLCKNHEKKLLSLELPYKI